MRSRASDAAMAMSRFQSLNSTWICALSALAREFIVRMPGMVASASSTGRSTLRSISSGVEPSYGSQTKKNGIVASGSASSGSRNEAIRPITTIDTNSMMVVTGRRMDSSVIFISGLRAAADRILLVGQHLLGLPGLAPGARAALDVVAVGLAVQQVVHHRDHHQGQQGRHQQAAD